MRHSTSFKSKVFRYQGSWYLSQYDLILPKFSCIKHTSLRYLWSLTGRTTCLVSNTLRGLCIRRNVGGYLRWTTSCLQILPHLNSLWWTQLTRKALWNNVPYQRGPLPHNLKVISLLMKWEGMRRRPRWRWLFERIRTRSWNIILLLVSSEENSTTNYRPCCFSQNLTKILSTVVWASQLLRWLRTW